VNQTCKFCGREAKLIEAHVIPRSFFRLDPSDRLPARLATNVEGRHAQNIPKGIYDRELLCLPCERQFSEWDDYGAELFVRGWSSIDTLVAGTEHVGYGLPSYDYDKLKLFFLSVLWRAHASAHTMFAKIDLGVREIALKQSLIDRNAGDLQHFGVVLEAFDDENVGMLNPETERIEGLRFVRMYLGHIIVFVKVDSQPFNDSLDHVAMGPGKPLALLKKAFRGSRERNAMLKLVKNSGPQK
jgi:hypothetical protein